MRVRGEFWGERLATNREATIPHGLSQLEASGALGNFANTARHIGRYVGGLDDSGLTFPFRDTDVYKWLEAVGWELAREDDLELSASAVKVVELVRTAQREDGYLGTFVQLSAREPYADLQWGHELFNVGHLLQAAVAWQQGSGDDSLMAVVAHAVDHIDATLGKGRREGVDGHPEIEKALVEAFRTTREERYLGLAQLLLERRGRGLLGPGRLGSRYWQDHAPVRSGLPWDGRVTVEVMDTLIEASTLEVRVPAWLRHGTVTRSRRAQGPHAGSAARLDLSALDGGWSGRAGLGSAGSVHRTGRAHRRGARLRGTRAWTAGLLRRSRGPARRRESRRPRDRSCGPRGRGNRYGTTEGDPGARGGRA